ncbi:hypothetical protein PMIN01_01564 [Paraphaeosphaeria minitans]|uniref:Uncharacterized protein n=1 Tax=Paraphaeosphaeria minitans TaxID=565426 RepID=A0A9P6GPV6_9PLEO|nr:hypothetical protein PMIN01_01564 [Paraphaeosphaeria minitans]
MTPLISLAAPDADGHATGHVGAGVGVCAVGRSVARKHEYRSAASATPPYPPHRPGALAGQRGNAGPPLSPLLPLPPRTPTPTPRRAVRTCGGRRYLGPDGRGRGRATNAAELRPGGEGLGRYLDYRMGRDGMGWDGARARTWALAGFGWAGGGGGLGWDGGVERIDMGTGGLRGRAGWMAGGLDGGLERVVRRGGLGLPWSAVVCAEGGVQTEHKGRRVTISTSDAPLNTTQRAPRDKTGAHPHVDLGTPQRPKPHTSTRAYLPAKRWSLLRVR